MLAIVDELLHSEATYPASPATGSQQKAFSVRLRGLLVAAPCWAIFILAATLEPATGGYGTHEQLGGPPCSFLVRTGWPCPSCGMTTSLSATAHGWIALGWRAQPFGVVLFAAMILLGAIGSFELLTNRSVLHRLRPKLWWGLVLLGGMLVGWGWNAATGWAGGKYPLP